MVVTRRRIQQENLSLSKIAATPQETPPLPPEAFSDFEYQKKLEADAARAKSEEKDQRVTWITVVSLTFMTAVFLPLSFLGLLNLFLESPIAPQRYLLQERPNFDGLLLPNSKLQDGEKIYVNGVTSFVIRDGHVYAAVEDGRILKVKDDRKEQVAHIQDSTSCGSSQSEKCGCLVALQFDQDGRLLALDTNNGLYRIHTDSGSVEMLLSTAERGDKLNHLSGFVVGANRTIYFTSASSKWSRSYSLYAMFDHASGNLYSLAPAGEVTQLTRCYYPSSIAWYVDPVTLATNSLLVTELPKARLRQYYIPSELKMRRANFGIFAENLPGLPSAISPSNTGGYWIGFYAIRRAEWFSVVDLLSTKTSLAKVLSKFLPRSLLHWLAFHKYGLVVKLDEDGNIIRSLHDTTGSTVSSVHALQEADGYLYVLDQNKNYIVKIEL